MVEKESPLNGAEDDNPPSEAASGPKKSHADQNEQETQGIFFFQIHQIKHKFCISNAPHVSSGTNNGEDVPEGETGTASPPLSSWEYVDDPLPPVRHKFYLYIHILKCNLGDRVIQS